MSRPHSRDYRFESAERNLEDEQVSVFSSQAESIDPRDSERKFTAPSGFDTEPTKAEPVVGEETTDTEPIGLTPEELDRERKERLARALGNVTLSTEAMDFVFNTPKLHQLVDHYAINEAGEKFKSDATFQETVTKWANSMEQKARAAAVPEEALVPQQSKTPSAVDAYLKSTSQSHSDEKGRFRDRVAGTPLVVVATILNKWQTGRERAEAKSQERVASKKANLANLNLTKEQLREKEEKIDRKEIRRSKVMYAGKIATLAAFAAVGIKYIPGLQFSGGKNLPDSAHHLFDQIFSNSPDTNKVPNGDGIHPIPGKPKLPLVPADQLPGAPKTPNQIMMDNYFNAPNTADIPVGPGGKHSINDFGPGSIGLANGDKNLAVADIEKMLRGNAHITASYLSEMGIGGAPKMPSIQEMNANPGLRDQFHIDLNNWMDGLTEQQRYDFTQEAVNTLKDANFGNPVEFQSGYASWGINESGEQIFGTHKGQVFYDTVVNKSGVKFIPVYRPDGSLIGYLNEDCDQWSTGSPYVAQAYVAPVKYVPHEVVVPKPAPRYVETQQVVPVYEQPVSHPQIPVTIPTGGGSIPIKIHHGGGSHPNTPVSPAKNPLVDHNVSPTLDVEKRMGNDRFGSGPLQSRSSLGEQPKRYTPSVTAPSSNDTAPGARSGTGLFGGGQRQQTGTSNGATRGSVGE